MSVMQVRVSLPLQASSHLLQALESWVHSLGARLAEEERKKEVDFTTSRCVTLTTFSSNL